MEARGIAVVFPGQGSQHPGMGQDFYDLVKTSRQVYEEASDALGWDVAALCFGQDDHLNLTEFTQPSIVTTEIAMLRGLKEAYDLRPTFFGGHSLGEFTALVAAGSLPLSEAVRIVQVRGRLMQQAVPVGIGGMAAVICENIALDRVRSAIGGLPVDIANINSANQIVISGELEAFSEAQRRLHAVMGEDRPLRFVQLNVSAPFHSRFMGTIEIPFWEVLQSSGKSLNPEFAGSVTSNFTGKFHTRHAEDIQDGLVSQLSHAVQWRDNMEQISARADTVYEVGPGRPLRDFFKTIGVSCSSITTFSTAKKLFEKVTETKE